MNTSPRTLDLSTAAGVLEHLRTLPTANLEAIAARPAWDAESTVLVVTAALVLAARS